MADSKHEFVSDWYRPARCQACGERREHVAHVSDEDAPANRRTTMQVSEKMIEDIWALVVNHTHPLTYRDQLKEGIAGIVRRTLAAAEPGPVATITIDGCEYRKFIPYPEEITDGTLRCISCGQIDEDEYHDDACCPAIPAPLPADAGAVEALVARLRADMQDRHTEGTATISSDELDLLLRTAQPAGEGDDKIREAYISGWERGNSGWGTLNPQEEWEKYLSALSPSDKREE